MRPPNAGFVISSGWWVWTSADLTDGLGLNAVQRTDEVDARQRTRILR